MTDQLWGGEEKRHHDKKIRLGLDEGCDRESLSDVH